MSEPGDRPLPWAELLLSLPLIAFVAYAAGVRDFPWGTVLLYGLIGAGIGYRFARRQGLRPFVGIFTGMLICFPLNLLLFLIDPRKPRPRPDPGLGPGEAAGAPPAPVPTEPEPGRGLAKASAFLGISGFLCWGLCGLAPVLGLLLGLVALALSVAKPERFAGRGLAAAGIASSLVVGFLVLTGPVPRPTKDFMDSRTGGEKAVVDALRANVADVASRSPEDRPASLGPEDIRRSAGWSYSYRRGDDGAFVFLAVPIERRWSRRLREAWWRPPRAFCADDSGRVCFTQGGPDPSPRAERCPPAPECLDP